MSTEETTAVQANGHAAAAVADRFEPCENCGAPLDHKQRYCVNCATRRADPSNPATRYFAASSRRARMGAPKRAASGASPARAAAVVFMILLPAAVGIGVLVGRAGDNGSGDNAELLAALDERTVAAAGSGDTSQTVSNTGGDLVTSDFALDKGFAVQLETLPASSDATATDKAVADAESNGAKDVGIIVPADFEVTPDPGGDYIVYSGEFEKEADATKALGDLKSDYEDAKVIEVAAVTAAGGGGGSTANGGTADTSDGAGGETIVKTDYGDVHKVEGIAPTEADEEEGAAIAEEQATETGDSYIDGQKGLPDVIAVGE